MDARGNEPKYLNPENFTSRDTVEGMRLAAQHHLQNATTPEERRRAQTGIDLTTKWIEDKVERDGANEDPWYYGVTLSDGSISQHLTRATIEGDMDALKFLNGWMRRESARLPESISKGYVGSLYAKMKLMATSPNATQEDIDNWERFQQEELPILMTALRLGDKPPTDIVGAYDAWVQTKADPNSSAEDIQAAGQRYQTLLNVEADKAIAKGSSEPTRFIKKNPDLTFEVVVGYQTTDPNNPGRPRFMANDGTELPPGYEVHDPDTYKEAKKVITAARTEASAKGGYKDSRENVVTALSLYGDVISIIDETPLALTSVAGGVAWVSKVGREIAAVNTIASNFFAENGKGAELTLAEMESRLRDEGILETGETLQDRASQSITAPELSTEAATIARNQSILVSKLLLLTFRAGGLEGQTGNAMSNRDFVNLQRMITGSSNPEVFKTVITDYIDLAVTGVNQKYKRFTPEDFGELQGFINEFGYNPLNNDSITMSFDRAIETSIDTDPRLKRGYELFQQYRGMKQPDEVEATGNALADLEASYSSGETITVTQEFLDKYPQLEQAGVTVGSKINNQGGN
jgi:hypothetical protein